MKKRRFQWQQKIMNNPNIIEKYLYTLKRRYIIDIPITQKIKLWQKKRKLMWL